MGFSVESNFKISKEHKDFLKRLISDALTEEEEARFGNDFSSLDTRTHEEIIRDATLHKSNIDFPTRSRK